jgi:hypothetical protein
MARFVNAGRGTGRQNARGIVCVVASHRALQVGDLGSRTPTPVTTAEEKWADRYWMERVGQNDHGYLLPE